MTPEELRARVEGAREVGEQQRREDALAWMKSVRPPPPPPLKFSTLSVPKEKPVPVISPERQLEIAIASLERREAALPEHAQEILRLHGRKLSDPEIAARVGCTTETVLRWRRRLSLPANTTGGQNTSRYLPPMRRVG